MLKPRFDPLRFTRPCGVSLEERRKMIIEAAYFIAQGRNFEQGGELSDWLLAETQVDYELSLRWVKNYG